MSDDPRTPCIECGEPVGDEGAYCCAACDKEPLCSGCLWGDYCRECSDDWVPDDDT